MADTWVQRGADEYAQAIESELPTGAAWPRDPASDLMRWVAGCAAIWGDVDARAEDLAVVESDPRYSLELLPDWERAFGLPDICVQTPQTIVDRRNALVLKITSLGGQSRAFFIAMAAALGYTVTIYEYAPYTSGISQCGDTRPAGDLSITFAQCGLMQCGVDPICTIVNLGGDEWECELGAPEIRYYWKVKVLGTRLTWLQAGLGVCGQDHECEIGIADDLECLFRRLKPGHTEVIFDYSNIDTSSAGTLSGAKSKTSALPYFFIF